FPDEPSYAPVRAVLEVLVAAREPLSEGELGRITLLGEDELARALRALGSYLAEQDGRLTLYHKSFADWLTDPALLGSLHAVRRRRGHERLAASLLGEYRRGVGQMSPLGVHHLLYHAACAGDEEAVGRLLADAGYLARRVEAAGAGPLI